MLNLAVRPTVFLLTGKLTVSNFKYMKSTKVPLK